MGIGSHPSIGPKHSWTNVGVGSIDSIVDYTSALLSKETRRDVLFSIYTRQNVVDTLAALTSHFI